MSSYSNAETPAGSGASWGSARDHPTVLTPADIREFQRLVHDRCGVALTDVEAWNRASVLISLYRMILRPIPEDPGSDGSSDIGRLPSWHPRKVR